MHTHIEDSTRRSVVVERDWLRGEWVITRAVSSLQGVVIARSVTRWPADLYDAQAVEQLVYDAILTPPSSSGAQPART